MTKYRVIPWDNDSNSPSDENLVNSTYVKFEEYYDAYEPTHVCPECHGTGLDEWEFDDCPVCWGEGEIRQGGLTGRR